MRRGILPGPATAGRRTGAALAGIKDGTARGFSTTTMTSFSKEGRSARWLRLHSATGVLPLGAFLVLHLWINGRATQGREAYDGLVRRIQSTPGLVVLEVLGIYAPLLFHAAYGAWLTGTGQPLRPPPPHAKSWARPLQRATGAATLAFLGYHLWTVRLQTMLGNLRSADFFPALTDTLSATTRSGIPLAAAAYLVGLAAASYHLANGLTGFCLDLGLATTARATRMVSLACTISGMALFLLGANTVVYFATGGTWPTRESLEDLRAVVGAGRHR
jgi:succinate dehydrogenase/fumarate reductase cytochrome b subunit (b558 family)